MARRNKATENAALTWIAAELHSTRPGPAARRVLDFVCDLTRYRTADTKIGKVLSLERDGHDQIVRSRSRLRDLPGPLVRQRIHRAGDTRIDITDVSRRGSSSWGCSWCGWRMRARERLSRDSGSEDVAAG